MGRGLTSIFRAASRARSRVVTRLAGHVPSRELEREDAMTLPAETDTTSPKYLRDKYAIVGVGEAAYMPGSGLTTRALGPWAAPTPTQSPSLKPTLLHG